MYAAGGIPESEYSSIRAVSAIVDRAALGRLADNPYVSRISLDYPVQGVLSSEIEAIGADQAWAGVAGYPGVTGKGVTVAVLDSGITPTPDLEKRVIYSASFIGSSDTKDYYGHGTHVAGIIASSGYESKPGKGFTTQYKGVAPDARLINLKVLGDTGAGSTSGVIAALDWCVRKKTAYGIRIINISLGHPVFESYKTDPLCRAVESCVKAGMVVVVAAGNYGKNEKGKEVYLSLIHI